MLKRLYFGLLFMTAIGTFAAQAQTDDSAGVGPSAHYHLRAPHFSISPMKLKLTDWITGANIDDTVILPQKPQSMKELKAVTNTCA